MKKDTTIPQGSYVSFTYKGEEIAYGFYENIGAIGARILAYKHEGSGRELEEIVDWRLKKALKLREETGEKNEEGYRYIYADSDGMPGLIADVYNDTTILQSTSIGWDKNIQLIAEKIAKLGVTKRVYLKNDQRTRKILGLNTEKKFLIGKGKPQTIIREGEISIKIDFEKGHKTGFYLDQRPARLRIGRMNLHGYKVLDLFSYTGAFSLQTFHAGADTTILVEENNDAVKTAMENIVMNNYSEKGDIVRARVEKILDSLVARKKRFNFIIADPPAFIPTPEQKERGYRAYYKLLSNITGIIEPSGYIYASSCSYHLSREELLTILRKNLEKKGYQLKIIFEHTPTNATPYTRIQDTELRYLKGFLVKVE